MHSRWDGSEAAAVAADTLALRVYSSRLLGSDPSLVLHGGGNTSVKATTPTLFGEVEEVLFVKGSGWDLATIEAEGFAPVRLDALRRMAELKELSDSAMVTAQRAAMTNPYAPNPSVEAILHAIIPFRFVDHTHADAVVALTNTPNGAAKVRELYGPQMLIVPYVMPGFILARKIYEMTRAVDWERLPGMILLNHGVFTFADAAPRELRTPHRHRYRRRGIHSGAPGGARHRPLFDCCAGHRWERGGAGSSFTHTGSPAEAGPLATSRVQDQGAGNAGFVE